MNAIVVFHGFNNGLFFKVFGRAGFRHCFVAIKHQGTWLRADFQDGIPSLEVICADTFDLAAFYRAAGLTVAEATIGDKKPRLPFMLGTCVGLTKRFLGIRSSLCITPHQLYRHLKAA